MVVYVDDFKLACPQKYTEGIWKQVGSLIELDKPAPVDRFLGCYAKDFETTAGRLSDFMANKPELHIRGEESSGEPIAPPTPIDPKKKIRGRIMRMRQYLVSSVERYCKVAKIEKSRLRKVDTPFLDESKFPQGCTRPPTADGIPEDVD